MKRSWHLLSSLICLLVLLLLFSPAAKVAAMASPSEQPLRRQLEQILTTGRAPLAGEPVPQPASVRDVYAREQFKPLWTPERSKQLLAAIEACREDGLQPDDYHHQALRLLGRRLASEPDSHRSAEYEILLTDALLGLGHDKYYGKIDPKTLFPDWNLNNPRKEGAMQPLLSALKNGRLQQFLSRLGPMQPVYAELKQALAKY